MKRITLVTIFLGLIVSLVGGCSNSYTTKSTFKQIKSTVVTDDYVIVKRFTGFIDPSWAEKLEPAFQDPHCKVVLAWIDSPGGSAVYAEQIAHNFKAMRDKYNKPLWIFSEYCLASGAYWIGVVADTIVASPVSVVGSIGVVSGRPDITAADSITGVKWWIFYSSAQKVFGNPHIKMTPLEADYFRRNVTSTYIRFVKHVYTHRFSQFVTALQRRYPVVDSMDVVNLALAVSTGLVYSAEESYKYGMIDKVLYFDELVEFFHKKGLRVRTLEGIELEMFYKEK